MSVRLDPKTVTFWIDDDHTVRLTGKKEGSHKLPWVDVTLRKESLADRVMPRASASKRQIIVCDWLGGGCVCGVPAVFKIYFIRENATDTLRRYVCARHLTPFLNEAASVYKEEVKEYKVLPIQSA